MRSMYIPEHSYGHRMGSPERVAFFDPVMKREKQVLLRVMYESIHVRTHEDLEKRQTSDKSGH